MVTLAGSLSTKQRAKRLGRTASWGLLFPWPLLGNCQNSILLQKKKKKKGSQGALSAAAGDLCSSSCSPAPWVLRRKVAAVTPKGNTCLTQEIGTLSTFHQQPDSRSHTWKDLHQSSPGHSHPKPVDHYYIEVLPLSSLFFFLSEILQPWESYHCNFPYQWPGASESCGEEEGRRLVTSWREHEVRSAADPPELQCHP